MEEDEEICPKEDVYIRHIRKKICTEKPIKDDDEEEKELLTPSIGSSGACRTWSKAEVAMADDD